MTCHTSSVPGATRAVVFDIDGTLYPTRRIAWRSLPLIAGNLRLFHAFGKARQALRRELPGPALRQRQAELVARSLGIDAADAARRIEQVVYRQWPRCFGRLRPYDGVVETLAALRRKGLRLGVVSDSPFTREKLAALGLHGGWNAVVSADEAGALKPNPEPFLRIARLLGVAPGEVLFVGNSYRRDVIGAHHAGMRAAHFTRRPVRAGVADVSFAHYRRFPRVVPAPLMSERTGSSGGTERREV
ncbi:MAG: HAD family hydrolase [Spirochaetaceae bacterium]|nr:HAD family hydrolase [Spirochaetaceae bacterium]